MARPCKCRRVGFAPDAVLFKPAGVPGHDLREVLLTLDELEALRLADLEGLYQEQAAEKMGVSRQTFGNLVAAARRKTADCLVNATILRIAGGVVEATGNEFACQSCRHHWSVPAGGDRLGKCPACNARIMRRDAGDGNRRRQGGRPGSTDDSK